MQVRQRLQQLAVARPGPERILDDLNGKARLALARQMARIVEHGAGRVAGRLHRIAQPFAGQLAVAVAPMRHRQQLQNGDIVRVLGHRLAQIGDRRVIVLIADQQLAAQRQRTGIGPVVLEHLDQQRFARRAIAVGDEQLRESDAHLVRLAGVAERLDRLAQCALGLGAAVVLNQKARPRLDQLQFQARVIGCGHPALDLGKAGLHPVAPDHHPQDVEDPIGVPGLLRGEMAQIRLGPVEVPDAQLLADQVLAQRDIVGVAPDRVDQGGAGLVLAPESCQQRDPREREAEIVGIAREAVLDGGQHLGALGVVGGVDPGPIRAGSAVLRQIVLLVGGPVLWGRRLVRRALQRRAQEEELRVGVVDREGVVEGHARGLEIADPEGGRRTQRKHVDIVGRELEGGLARRLRLLEIADGQHDLPEAQMTLVERGVELGHRAEMLQRGADFLLLLADLAEFEMRARHFGVQLEGVAQFDPRLDALALGEQLDRVVEMALRALLGAVTARNQQKRREPERPTAPPPPRRCSDRHPSARREHPLSPSPGTGPDQSGHAPRVVSNRERPPHVPSDRSHRFLHDRSAFYRPKYRCRRDNLSLQRVPARPAATASTGISPPTLLVHANRARQGQSRARRAGTAGHALPSER